MQKYKGNNMLLFQRIQKKKKWMEKEPIIIIIVICDYNVHAQVHMVGLAIVSY